MCSYWVIMVQTPTHMMYVQNNTIFSIHHMLDGTLSHTMHYAVCTWAYAKYWKPHYWQISQFIKFLPNKKIQLYTHTQALYIYLPTILTLAQSFIKINVLCTQQTFKYKLGIWIFTSQWIQRHNCNIINVYNM